MINQVQVLNVPVSDQQAAFEFYVDTLGLTVVADYESPQGRWLQVAPRGAATTLALVADPNGAGKGGLVFETDDIDGDFAALQDKGVAFTGGITQMPWARCARFVDPDGNQLGLQTSGRQ